MTIVGGLRYRFVCDSVVEMIRSNLASLGWFDAGRAHRPIILLDEEQPFDKEVALNTLAVAPSTTAATPAEMGSNLENNSYTFYADFYAEDDSVGRHMAMDLVDILKGKFPTIGRTAPNVQVFDFTADPPVPLFFCDIENVVFDKAATAQVGWQRHWFVVRFDVIDTYGDEDDFDAVPSPAAVTGPQSVPHP